MIQFVKIIARVIQDACLRLRGKYKNIYRYKQRRGATYNLIRFSCATLRCRSYVYLPETSKQPLDRSIGETTPNWIMHLINRQFISYEWSKPLSKCSSRDFHEELYLDSTFIITKLLLVVPRGFTIVYTILQFHFWRRGFLTFLATFVTTSITRIMSYSGEKIFSGAKMWMLHNVARLNCFLRFSLYLSKLLSHFLISILKL